MKPRNFLISIIVLLAGLTAGYFASRSANDFLKTPTYEQELDSITPEWVEGYYGTDPRLLANMILLHSKSYDGLSLRLEPPPMSRLNDWNILGASSAVFSHIYIITKEHFQEVINEGLYAVKGAVETKELLLESREYVSANAVEYDRMIASVDYHIELYRLLDYYRQFFMHYYRWIETGDARSKTSYQLAMGQFKAVMKFHEQKYEKNPDTQGMDIEEAKRGLAIIENTGRSVRWARVVVVLSLFLLILGIPGIVRDRANRRFAGTLYFDAIFRPSRLGSHNVFHGSTRLALFMVALYLLGLLIFSSFTSLLFPIVIGGLGLIYVFTLAFLINRGRNFRNILISLMAPKVLLMAFILLIVAIRGPLYFWYWMWASDLFRTFFFSLLIMFLFRKFHIYLVLSGKWSNGNITAAFARVFITLGAQLLLIGLALQFFGLERSLTILNNDLLVLPGGLSTAMGITTHLGIPTELALWIIYFASGLMAAMFAILKIKPWSP